MKRSALFPVLLFCACAPASGSPYTPTPPDAGGIAAAMTLADAAMVVTDAGTSGGDAATSATDAAIPAHDAAIAPACVATTCAAQNAACGTISDGCGGMLTCATPCPTGQACGATNQCYTPAPFDDNACTGASMTWAEAVGRILPGNVGVVLGTGTAYYRTRYCDPVSGCGAWSAPAAAWGLGGTQAEDLDGGPTKKLTLESSTCELTGHPDGACLYGDVTSLAAGVSQQAEAFWLYSDSFFQTGETNAIGITAGAADIGSTVVLTDHCFRYFANANAPDSTELEYQYDLVIYF
jgi:hypothetical protein